MTWWNQREEGEELIGSPEKSMPSSRLGSPTPPPLPVFFFLERLHGAFSLLTIRGVFLFVLFWRPCAVLTGWLETRLALNLQSFLLLPFIQSVISFS